MELQCIVVGEIMKQCIICNENIDNDTIYCPHCGEFNSICGKNFEDTSEDELFKAMDNAQRRRLN